MSIYELPGELATATASDWISLVKSLEEGELRRLKSFFIYDWLNTPDEVLVFVCLHRPKDQISRLEVD